MALPLGRRSADSNVLPRLSPSSARPPSPAPSLLSRSSLSPPPAQNLVAGSVPSWAVAAKPTFRIEVGSRIRLCDLQGRVRDVRGVVGALRVMEALYVEYWVRGNGTGDAYLLVRAEWALLGLLGRARYLLSRPWLPSSLPPGPLSPLASSASSSFSFLPGPAPPYERQRSVDTPSISSLSSRESDSFLASVRRYSFHASPSTEALRAQNDILPSGPAGVTAASPAGPDRGHSPGSPPLGPIVPAAAEVDIGAAGLSVQPEACWGH